MDAHLDSKMIVLLLLLVSISSAWSFTTNHPPFSSSTRTPPPPLFLSAAPTNEEDPSTSCVDIVLFGIGDLRTTDHPGLVNAFSKNNSRVLPLLILDTQNTLPNIPMARTHTLDTAALLLAGIQSLQTQLKQLGLQLHVKTGKNAILKELLTDVLQELSARDLQNNITVHACDLGLVDRQFLGYSPLTYLLSEQPSSNDDVLFQLQTWDCHLRSNAWEDVQENLSQFPKNFVEFEQQYIHNEKVVAGNTATIPSNNKHNGDFTIDSILGIPSLEEIEELLCVAVGYDHRDKKLLECDRNTGLFVTHWGGLGVETFDETTILQALDSFLGLNGKEEEGDKALIKEFQWWSLLKSMRNELSLEHAAMNWMMKGDGDGDGTNVQTQNLIEDELLTRYLAAPLLFGMVSPRYMWNRANDAAKTKPKSLSALFPALPQSRGTVDAVKMIVESREWHTLFASKMMIEAANNEKNDDDFHIGYWRWHGFLCRYVSTSNTHRTGDDSSNLGNKKEGITLIHGFGASGNQWKKAMGALKKLSHVEGKSKVEALAPDLIGFGQSEKPSLTYTQYLWESYSAAFIKEVAIGKHNWNFFTVGGNSIGGYTAMSLAADDTVVNGNGGVSCVTASGANGSTKCKGLVLMNSAGKVFNRQDIEAMKGDRVTIAEATSSDLLGVSR